MNTFGPYVITPIANAFNWMVENPIENKSMEFKSKFTKKRWWICW